jgi:putative spermidine/putrescine transport system permease protein
MFLPPEPSPLQRAALFGFHAVCALVFLFLLAPIVVIIPLSFNSGPFLTYPLEGLSLRWYEDFFTSPRWLPALQNSFIVAIATTILATPLGTLAALGLARSNFPLKKVVVGLLISPMIVPVIIIAIAVYFVFSPLRLTGSLTGLVLAHTVLAVPFVVIAVHATLQGFDPTLWRAGASLGARPTLVFRRVVLPLIAPGVLSGALFAFVASFDELVTTIFLAGPQQRTLPLQMFDGVREQISPTITAAASLLIALSVLLLGSVELLRRRGRRLQAARARAG